MAVIDQTYMINRARAFLGQNVTGQTDFNDADFLKCLSEVTLPTFSIYAPYMEDIVVNVLRDQIDPSRPQIYAMRTNMDIIGVDHVREGTDAFGAFPYSPMLTGDTLDRQLVADRRSMTEVQLTHEFRPPNIVEIYPKGLVYTTLTVKTKLVHPLHLRTVHAGSREHLKDLFLADLALDVLSVRQYFQSLQSVFGELTLNLERLQNQANKRDDIIQFLASKQLKTGTIRRMWIA